MSFTHPHIFFELHEFQNQYITSYSIDYDAYGKGIVKFSIYATEKGILNDIRTARLAKLDGELCFVKLHSLSLKQDAMSPAEIDVEFEIEGSAEPDDIVRRKCDSQS